MIREMVKEVKYFVTSLKVLEGDKIFDQGTAEVKYSSPSKTWRLVTKYFIEIYEK